MLQMLQIPTLGPTLKFWLTRTGTLNFFSTVQKFFQLPSPNPLLQAGTETIYRHEYGDMEGMYPDTVSILILQQTGAGYVKEQENDDTLNANNEYVQKHRESTL